MLKLRHLPYAALVSVLAAVAATPASASQGSGVSFTPFINASLDETVHFNHDEIKVQTKNPTDVRMQKIEFGAGSYTGWHHHEGIVIFALKSGSVTFWDSNCQPTTYEAGAVFMEGDDHAHQATSSAGATAYVTYIVPDGANFRAEDSAPLCATSIDALAKVPPRN